MRIVGDFVFAVWDDRRQQLFCARDILGKRPLFYWFDGRVFRCASEMQQLFVDEVVGRRPNEGMAAEFLASAVTSTTETLFRDVFRLAPAHSMTVSSSGLRMKRYWQWDSSAEVRHRSDAEYAEHFLEQFREVLRAHLRTIGPVGVTLSGGLDSTSVLSVAQDELNRSGSGLRLEAYSMTFPGRACDESGFIDEVVRRWDVPSHRVVPVPMGADYYQEQVVRYLDIPEYPNNAMCSFLSRAGSANGVRTLLTGDSGDWWLTGSRLQCADLIRRGRLAEVARRLRPEAEYAGLSPWMTLRKYGLRPLVPAAARNWRERLLGVGPARDWLPDEFKSRVSLNDRIRVAPNRGRPSFAAVDLAGHLDSGDQVHSNELGDRSAAAIGHEWRDPLGDRRLVELTLALPEEQRRRGRMTKFVLRQATAGLMPEPVRQRLDKADFSHAFVEELLSQGGAPRFEALAIEELGWVDGPVLRRMYQDMSALYLAGDLRYTALVWPLWTVAWIDRWYSEVGGASSEPKVRGRPR